VRTTKTDERFFFIVKWFLYGLWKLPTNSSSTNTNTVAEFAGNLMSKPRWILSLLLLGFSLSTVTSVGVVQAKEAQPQENGQLLPTNVVSLVANLTFQFTDKWRANLIVFFYNRGNVVVHVPWVELTFVSVTYTDGSSEEWGIKDNFTTNYAVPPILYAQLGPIRITEAGFDKQPSTINYELQYRIVEAGEVSVPCVNSACTSVPIPEFSNATILFCSTLLGLIFVISVRKRHR